MSESESGGPARVQGGAGQVPAETPVSLGGECITNGVKAQCLSSPDWAVWPAPGRVLRMHFLEVSSAEATSARCKRCGEAFDVLLAPGSVLTKEQKASYPCGLFLFERRMERSISRHFPGRFVMWCKPLVSGFRFSPGAAAVCPPALRPMNKAELVADLGDLLPGPRTEVKGLRTEGGEAGA